MKAIKTLALLTAVLLMLVAVPIKSVTITAAAETHSVYYSYNGGYYTDNGYDVSTLLSQSGTALFNNLHSLMTSTHANITSYNGIRELFVNSDADPAMAGNIILFYSGASVEGEWDAGATYNREHVWPQSRGSFTTSNAGADLHHIRPEDAAVNSTRGNLLMAWVDTAAREITYNNSGIECYTNPASDSFEPRDEVKGDVARIYFYLACRWGEDLASPVYDDTYETLLQWNMLDPVDAWELARNDYVESVQGNRNVFIDYPEFGRLIYGESQNGFNYAVETAGDYSYSVANGQATILNYTGNAANVTIPSVLGGYTVTKLGSAAFANNTTLATVTIPSTITSIGAYAFYNAVSLSAVYVGSGVTTFERRAFRDCNSLRDMYFYGSAPVFLHEGSDQIMISGTDNGTAPANFKIHYIAGQSGWTSGRWSSANGAYSYTTSTWAGEGEVTPDPNVTTQPTTTPAATSTPTPTASPMPLTGEYALVTDIDAITTGYYVLYGVNGSYAAAMTNTCFGGRMGAATVTLSGNTIVAPDESMVWYLEEQPVAKRFSLYNEASGQYCMISANSTSGFSVDDSPTQYFDITAASESEGVYYMTTTLAGCSRMISIYQNDFRPYNSANWNELYLYKFTGAVAPDETPVASYTVRFFDWDGSLLSSQLVEHGQSAIPPASPTRTGHTFTGWDADYANITQSIDINATYMVNSYTLTINYVYDNGEIAAADYSQTVTYGSSYSIASPQITGYTPDIELVAGTMGAANATFTVTYMKEAAVGLLGDANLDGVVTFIDVSLIYANLMNSCFITEQGRLNCDINGDGAVNFSDISLLYSILINS